MEEPRARAIAQKVTELGREIGLLVVVEGVTSPEVAELVRGMGAHYGQGSLFGAACPLAEVPGLQAAVTAQRSTAPGRPGPRTEGSPTSPHGAVDRATSRARRSGPIA